MVPRGIQSNQRPTKKPDLETQFYMSFGKEHSVALAMIKQNLSKIMNLQSDECSHEEKVPSQCQSSLAQMVNNAIH